MHQLYVAVGIVAALAIVVWWFRERYRALKRATRIVSALGRNDLYAGKAFTQVAPDQEQQTREREFKGE